MFSSFRHLFKISTKSFIPLLSITLLNQYHKSIFNSVQSNTQHDSTQQSQNNNSSISKNLNQQHEAWHWDRILQINSPQQLTHNDILQKTIICYQMTGNQQIDSQVALISHLFCDKFFGKISERFQFVFLTPNPHNYQDDEIFYVVFGKEGSKFVSLKKYLNTHPEKTRFIPNFNPLHSRLLQQVNKYYQISLNNINQHLQHLGTIGRDTYQLAIVPQNNSQQQINKSKKVLQRFLKNKQIWNSQIVKSIVTDEQSKIILGLNREGIEKNKVYLISPKSNNLINVQQARKNKQFFKIQNKNYFIVSGQQIQSKFVFPPIPPKLSQQSYILKFNIDLNQSKPQFLQIIYDLLKQQNTISKIKDIPRLLTFSKSDEQIQISIEKNNHDTIVNVYEEGCGYEDKDKRELLLKANTWKYPHEFLDSEKLVEFVTTVVNKQNLPQLQKAKQQYEFYRSEPQTQSQRKHSKLIVGQERKEVIQAPGDKIIFHYSKSCHSCKRFKGVYQNIAEQTKDVAFYRIDNDTNKSEGLLNYNSTPIFVMYKNGYTNIPWYFKMPYFTKTLFSNFVQITKEVQVLNKETFNKHVDEHISNQELVKSTLKEVL